MRDPDERVSPTGLITTGADHLRLGGDDGEGEALASIGAGRCRFRPGSVRFGARVTAAPDL